MTIRPVYRKLKEELELNPDLMGKVSTVDADSKDDSEYQDMILKEKLNSKTYVLITTSVIDNGINFKNDPSLKNIVVSDISIVKCQQMVGRVRVSNSEDKITLYIKRFKRAEFEKTTKQLETQIDAYHDLNLAGVASTYDRNFHEKYYNGNPAMWEYAKQWFAWEEDNPKYLYLNEIAKSLINQRKTMYYGIMNEMDKTDNSFELPGQQYLEYQLSWFGKEYDKSNDITLSANSNAKDDLIQFIDNHAVNGTKFYKEDQDKFRSDFTTLHDNVYPREDPNKERKYGKDIINKIFKEKALDYRLESKKDSKNNKGTFWIIEKITNVSE